MLTGLVAQQGRARMAVSGALLAVVFLELLVGGALLLQQTGSRTAVVSGVTVTGDSPAELRNSVVALAEQVSRVAVQGQAGEVTSTSTLGELGLTLDVDATTERVWTGQGQSVGSRVQSLAGAAPSVAPVLVSDPAAVRAAQERLAAALTRPPTEAGLDISPATGAVAVTPPAPGSQVGPEQLADLRELATRALAAGAVGAGTPIEVAVVPTRTEATIVEADAATAAERLEAVADGPVTFVGPDGTELASIDGRQLVGSFVAVPEPEGRFGGRLRLEGLENLVAADLKDALHLADRPPADARVVVDAVETAPPSRDDQEDPERFQGSVRVEPSQTGLTVDVPATFARLASAAGPGPERIVVQGEVVQPALDTAAAQQLGVSRPVSSFTTFYQPGQSRVTNIHRIAEIVDGALIRPGETFELNHFVGERTRARGFTTGGAILDGEFTTDVGGGVSQFATTFFNAAWFAGVDLLRFQPHSYYISRYPVGREATINYPNVDLEVRNSTPYGIVVKTSVTASSVTVTFWSTPHWQVETVTGPRRSTNRGFNITVERIRTDPAGNRQQEAFTTSYRLQ